MPKRNAVRLLDNNVTAPERYQLAGGLTLEKLRDLSEISNGLNRAVLVVWCDGDPDPEMPDGPYLSTIPLEL